MAASTATLIGDTFADKYSFASPEQVGLYGGKVDLRSDIYSLGLVLAAAAIGFGRKLDMGNSPTTMHAARQRVPDLSEVPEPLRQVIAPMLEPRPADRPPSMRSLLGYEGDARRKLLPGAQYPAAWSRRWRATLSAAAVGALAVLAGAALFILREVPPPSAAKLRAEVALPTAGYQCASLDYEVGPDRSVQISGYAASRDDIAQIHQAVGSVDGIAKLDFAVQLRIWPYCQVTISRIRISRRRAVGLWVPRPLGIPRLLRSSGLWIPRLFGSARFPRTPALWIPRLLGTTSLPRLTELWKPEPTAVLSLFRFRISRGWLSGRSPSGGLVARSRVRHRAFKLSFGLKFGIRNYANA
jgi:hypothetical protein